MKGLALRLTDTVAKILADDRVVSQLWDLVQGLGGSCKQFPIELEDWEYSLNTIHHIISEHLKEESQ